MIVQIRRKEGAAVKKMIPYSKLSKKQKRQIDAARRVGWGGLNPVTRKSADATVYNRKKARIREEDLSDPCFLFFPDPAGLTQRDGGRARA